MEIEVTTPKFITFGRLASPLTKPIQWTGPSWVQIQQVLPVTICQITANDADEVGILSVGSFM